jgi:hypothetical protein
MKTTMLSLILPTLLLAACGGTDNAGNGGEAAANGSETASASGFAGEVRAGQWTVTSTGDMQGEDDVCITAIQVQKGSFFGDNPEGMDQCTVVRDRMAGGTIDAEAQCGAGKHPLSFKGSYTADSFDVESTLEIPVGSERKTIRSRRVGKYVSENCTAKG